MPSATACGRMQPLGLQGVQGGVVFAHAVRPYPVRTRPVHDRRPQESRLKPERLLCPKPEGLYCAPGDFFIDPVRPVDRAVITHGHADHARIGPRRGGRHARDPGDHGGALRRGVRRHGRADRPMASSVTRDGVEVSLVPAGHVLGSAQAVVRCKGLTMVVSGDYKRRRDPTCPPFEPVPCDVFISEATFGLPVFRFPDDREEIATPARTRSSSSPSAATSSAPMRSARRSGSSACCARPARTETIYVHGALLRLNALYECLRRRPRPARARRPTGDEEGLRRQDHRRPALGPAGPLVAPLPRPGRRLRLGLDAGARPRPPARRSSCR